MIEWAKILFNLAITGGQVYLIGRGLFVFMDSAVAALIFWGLAAVLNNYKASA